MMGYLIICCHQIQTQIKMINNFTKTRSIIFGDNVISSIIHFKQNNREHSETIKIYIYV